MGKTEYQGWPNCYRLSNEHVELIVTTDIGPRIIRFGFVGQQNEFAEFADMMGKTGGDEWRIYGGHRLWHAPEAQPRSYIPDNQPITIEQHDNFVRLIQPTETTTGIQKEIDIYLSPDRAHVRVIHRMYNRGLWDVELSPWALSVMAPSGKAIIPLPPRGSHEENLLPTSILAIWVFTDLSEPRWTLGRQYVILRQDTSKAQPQKIGVMVTDGWAAYFNKGHVFVKTFDFRSGAVYPDFGCSVESFTNEAFLELETLGPLTVLAPGESVEHLENWSLFCDIPEPHTDADVEKYILPLIKV